MRSTSNQEREIATFLFNGDIEGIFDLFDAQSDASDEISRETVTLPFEHHLRNAKLLQQYVPEADVCVICGGEHATASCARLHGICYACGDRCFFGHSAANCPNRHRIELFATPKSFCCRCKLPLFEIAGIRLHSCEKSEIGFECKNSALADQVKMLLLAGEICGTQFGPGTYSERVSWVTASSPPNIVGLLARIVVQQHQQQQPPPRLDPIPRVACIATPTPAKTTPSSTPPTTQRTRSHLPATGPTLHPNESPAMGGARLPTKRLHVSPDQLERTLLARVAGQDKKPILATPSPVTPQQRSSTPVHAIHSPVPISPEIAERMRVNRLAALQRLNASSPFGPSQALSSLVPTTPSPATFSPLVSTPSPSLPETPQTQPFQRVPSGFLPCASKRQLDTQKLADPISKGLPPSVFPRDRCFKCAGKHRCDNCTEPPATCIRNLLIQARCCTKCAIPM